MKMDNHNADRKGVTRRRLLQGAAGAVAAAAVAGSTEASQLGLRKRTKEQPRQSKQGVVNGRINQSVCHWCFTGDGSPEPWTLEQCCQHAVDLGVKSVELVDAKNWDLLKKYGLTCAMANSHGFVRGLNDKANHDWAIDILKRGIDNCADAGFPTVITFSGFRNGIPDDVGLDNTVAGLKKVIGYAEKKKVNLCIEVLNSRVDQAMKGHPGYMCDTVEWAYEVCDRIASPRMTYLFDIYHVQVMQGDIITRIRDYHKYIGHYHTAGCPGRNEMDDTQEINYPPIMREIVKTGYKGYVGQEFIPTRNPLQSLREAVTLCDV
ncbi:MAG: sugar phosphate isomerase/epimerase family protein [Thermoguttaceae bacterium]